MRALVVALALVVAGCNGGTEGNGGTGPEGGVATGDAGSPGTGGSDPALEMVRAQIAAANVNKASLSWRISLPKPQVVTFTPGKSYFWTLATSKGVLRLKLDPATAPMHVTSTIYLTLLGFYDGLIFHRIVKGWVAQGGDPLGTGTGGPGYSYSIETSPTVKHDARGVLSMANAGPNTEGSQFFITFVPAPNLDGKFSAFGRLVDGAATLDAIEAVGTATDGAGKPGLVTIDSATVSVE